MQFIYLASYDREASVVRQASMPWASIYLLQQYLKMHPDLRKALLASLKRGGNSMRWNPTNILHRMQVVMNVFLNYHGWRTDGVLRAYPTVPTWNLEDVKTFGVVVRISNRELLMQTKDGIVPASEEVRLAEQSLAWVLWALFAHGEPLDLGQVGFW